MTDKKRTLNEDETSQTVTEQPVVDNASSEGSSESKVQSLKKQRVESEVTPAESSEKKEQEVEKEKDTETTAAADQSKSTKEVVAEKKEDEKKENEKEEKKDDDKDEKKAEATTTEKQQPENTDEKKPTNSSPWSFATFTSSNPDPSKPFASSFGFSSFSSMTSPFSFDLNSTSSFSSGFNAKQQTNNNNNNNNNSITTTTEVGESQESNDGEAGASTTGGDEDYLNNSTSNYVPILQNLQPVQIVTGEEDEKTICSAKAKLYILNETYKERGVGLLKLNKNTDGKSRLLLNVDGSKRSALNVAIFAKMKVEMPTEKSLRFTAFEEGKFHTFLVNMKKPEETEMFESNITKQIALLEKALPASSSTTSTNGNGQEKESTATTTNNTTLETTAE
ncbi:hypothetical protein PPL_07588 [Heterostelium album PN500]|uniref:RanBD1 domain-containing protein n=1 Tax=Heterostelium pallidum (strain ATCC 26659 / Pp 5 / PN500) TaxID=670386 RepID=D3BGD7_HETP5|nr:hypothetical protein PPL_07588 [Heterostelium album PN500]EFA79537.1 hypothetical protein PPL_07588 [Heterostelium album PN500]|eukprot:XP_020431658.1 hypothetical protein PPL_07588 [Heterostelium album PN500]